jgi:dipeptidyl aminopeptidase/acylaminoacyl peptidase
VFVAREEEVVFIESEALRGNQGDGKTLRIGFARGTPRGFFTLKHGCSIVPFAVGVVLCLALQSAVVVGQQASRRTHVISADDYFTQAWVFPEITISPDGKFVAYPEGRWQESTNDRKADLWLLAIDTREVRRLTFDRADDRGPQWSKDNQWIYFTGTRKRKGEKQPPYNGTTQVWRIGVDGGEPRAVTCESEGISQFVLDGDDTVYYTTSKTVVAGEWKTLKEKHPTLRYSHGVTKTSVLWKLDLRSWRKAMLVDQDQAIKDRVIKELAVAPGGGRIALITAPDDTTVSWEGKSDVDVFNTRTNKTTRLDNRLWRGDAPSPYGCSSVKKCFVLSIA